MLVARNFVISVILVLCVFPKYSTSVKPEDCIVGETYLSTSITDQGICVKCPKYWRNCYDEAISDQHRCVRSCRVNPEKPSSTTTGTGIPLTPTPSLSVEYVSAVQPAVDVKEGQKPLGGKDIVSTEMLLVICFLGAFCLFLIGVLVVMVFVRKRKTRPVEHVASQADGNEPGEQTPLTILETQPSAVQDRNTSIQEEDRPIVQASSSTRIGGLQETEETNFSSALNIAEEHHT